MELILKRIAKRKTYTIGKLYVREQRLAENPDATMKETFLCDTMEPTWRDYANGGRRIRDRSAIPEGRYLVLIVWNKEHRQWLPILWNVPMFKSVFVHQGEISIDTTGGILVGRNVQVGKVLDSNIWLQRLKHKILEAQQRGEQVWITIKIERLKSEN